MEKSDFVHESHCNRHSTNFLNKINSSKSSSSSCKNIIDYDDFLPLVHSSLLDLECISSVFLLVGELLSFSRKLARFSNKDLALFHENTQSRTEYKSSWLKTDEKIKIDFRELVSKHLDDFLEQGRIFQNGSNIFVVDSLFRPVFIGSHAINNDLSFRMLHPFNYLVKKN